MSRGQRNAQGKPAPRIRARGARTRPLRTGAVAAGLVLSLLLASRPALAGESTDLRVDEVTAFSVGLRWTPTADSGFLDYSVLQANGSTPWRVAAVIVDRNASSHTVDGLDPSATYTFRIATRSDAGTRESNTVTVTTLDLPAPCSEGCPYLTAELAFIAVIVPSALAALLFVAFWAGRRR